MNKVGHGFGSASGGESLRHLGSGIDDGNVTSVLPLFEIAPVLVRLDHVATSS